MQTACRRLRPAAVYWEDSNLDLWQQGQISEESANDAMDVVWAF
jgi:hypothetical protein